MDYSVHIIISIIIKTVIYYFTVSRICYCGGLCALYLLWNGKHLWMVSLQVLDLYTIIVIIYDAGFFVDYRH